MHPNAAHRHQVLEILYHALAKCPSAAWVNVEELDFLGEIEFALTSLLMLGQAEQSRLNWRITGAGMLAYEAAYPGA